MDKQMPTIVTYTGQEEVLMCLQSIEKEFLELFFNKTFGRDLDEYDRVAHVELYASFSLSTHICRNS